MRTLGKTLTTTLLLSALGYADGAWAHAHLTSATPAVDGTVSSANELRLSFSEGVEPSFTKVELSTNGQAVAVKTIATDPNDQKVLVVTPAHPLAAGSYKVAWHAVSVDTHRSEGVYGFSVKP